MLIKVSTPARPKRRVGNQHEIKGRAPRFSKGDKNIKDDSIGKPIITLIPMLRATPRTDSFLSKGDADQDHDQV